MQNPLLITKFPLIADTLRFLTLDRSSPLSQALPLLESMGLSSRRARSTSFWTAWWTLFPTLSKEVGQGSGSFGVRFVVSVYDHYPPSFCN